MADNVLTSLIGAVSGVIVTYITVRYRNQSSKPRGKDRIDTAFDMLEGVIKQLNAEIERKDKIIIELGLEIKQLKEKE